MTTDSTRRGLHADNLIERARIAYLKAGGREQPSSASDVTNIDGVVTVTLRNCNDVLAVYQLHGDSLKRQAVVAATVDQLFASAFDVPRDPRSHDYKVGVRAGLSLRIDGLLIRHPYPAGSAADDALASGVQEGHTIWRRAQAEAAGTA